MAFKKQAGGGDFQVRLMMEKVKREQQKRRAEELTTYRDWLKTACPELNWDFPHMEYIAEKLDQVVQGNIKRLMLLVPYQHGKSSVTSARFPAYLLERNPSTRIAVCSANLDLAKEFSRHLRNLTERRGIVELDQSSQSVERWMTKQGGGLKAVGVGGQIVGFPCDYIIIDDPVKSYDEANSKTVRDSTWGWYSVDVYSRQQKDTPIILIMTHWNEDDLAGRLLELDKDEEDEDYKWTVVRLPALCEGNDPEDYPVKREIDEPLCSELHPYKQLMNFRKTMGRMFAAGYQQRPAPLEGDIWKQAWFNKDKLPDAPLNTCNNFPQGVKISQVWDTSLDTKERNDPAAMVEGCMKDGIIYVAAMVNEKLEFPDLTRRMRTEMEAMKTDSNPVEVCVEDKASGKPARQQLKKEGIPIIEVASGTTDKTVRAKSVTSYPESGMVKLVTLKGNCNDELLKQLMLFPNGKHDDLHDAFVHLLRRLTGRSEPWSKETLAKMAQTIGTP